MSIPSRYPPLRPVSESQPSPVAPAAAAPASPAAIPVPAAALQQAAGALEAAVANPVARPAPLYNRITQVISGAFNSVREAIASRVARPAQVAPAAPEAQAAPVAQVAPEAPSATPSATPATSQPVVNNAAAGEVAPAGDIDIALPEIAVPAVAQPEVVPDRAQLISAAKAHLVERTNLKDLWKTKVTDQPKLLGRVTGFFSYLWNKSNAITQDGTADNLKKAAALAVDALARRSFIQDESPNYVLTAHPTEVSRLDTLVEQADAALETFYSAFRERVFYLGLQSEDSYFNYATAAIQLLEDVRRSKYNNMNSYSAKTRVRDQELLTKMPTMNRSFINKIVDKEILAGYKTSLESITPNSFKAKVSSYTAFTNCLTTICLMPLTPAKIEEEIRTKIKSWHSAEAIDGLRTEYANASKDNPRVIAIISDITRGLPEEQERLNRELAEYRGSNGFNGTFDAASKAVSHAGAELNRVLTVLRERVLAEGTSASNEDLEAIVNGNTTLGQDVRNARQALAAAQAEYDRIAARFPVIAQYRPDSNELKGGRLFDVNAEIAQASINARIEANKRAQFYNELNVVVNNDNRETSSRSLHAIIG